MLNNLCTDILRAFSVGTQTNNHELFDKAHDLSVYFHMNSATPALLDTVIELEYSVLKMTGPHKQFLEECIFGALRRSTCYYAPEDEPWEKLNQDFAEVGLTSEQKLRRKLALRIVTFSEQIFAQNRPRDTFANKRKCLAMGLLDRIDRYYDVPQCEKLYVAALASGKKALVPAAVEFYENYLRRRNAELTPEVLALLDKLVRKTKNRSVAVAALNLQVTTGVISELSALSDIDEWKEKNVNRW